MLGTDSRSQFRSISGINSWIHILILTVPAISILAFIPLGYASQNDPYESGYDHGCDDARISDS
jgi:hypothetical protein